MIYNEKLCLSDEMINNETDINEIINWKMEIEKELSEFNLRISSCDKLSLRQKTARSALMSLRSLCKTKIYNYNLKLKEEGKWNSHKDQKTKRHLASIFMEIAKKELNINDYNRILELSKSKLIENQQ